MLPNIGESNGQEYGNDMETGYKLGYRGYGATVKIRDAKGPLRVDIGVLFLVSYSP